MSPLCTNTTMWAQQVRLPLALQFGRWLFNVPFTIHCEDKLLVIESTATTGVTRAHCKDFVVKHHSVKSF